MEMKVKKGDIIFNIKHKTTYHVKLVQDDEAYIKEVKFDYIENNLDPAKACGCTEQPTYVSKIIKSDLSTYAPFDEFFNSRFPPDSDYRIIGFKDTKNCSPTLWNMAILNRLFKKNEDMNKNLSFGKMLEGIKQGKLAYRNTWADGNLIYLNKGSRDISDGAYDVEDHDNIEGIPFDMFEMGDVGTVTRLPNINMSTDKGRTLTGWLPSQSDILAEDWSLVPKI